MNIFKQTASMYRLTLKQNQDAPEDVKQSYERQANFYERLGDLTDSELLAICDTGIFNDAIKGYLLMALEDIEATEETQRNALDALRLIFDTVPAEQAAEHYRKF